MFELTKLISTIILPPFSVIILWLLSILLWALKCKKTAFFSTILGISILYVVSIPYTVQTISDSLVKEDKLSLADYRQAQAIVILGGGLRDNKELYHPLTVPGIVLERMRYAAYLHKETALPILVTGASPNGNSEAQIMKQELFSFFGVQTKWLEEYALNTKQNAEFTAQILQPQGIKKIILVTNQWHMQRAKMLFEKQGFNVLPASIGNGITPQSYELNYMHFIPQAGAMSANVQLLKEWIGYLKEKL